MSTVFPSKYEAEIVTVRWNFADVLPFGVLPVSAVVTVSLNTGTDPVPSDLLLGTATVSGTIVAQQLTQGYPGDVYVLTCRAVDVSGNAYYKTSMQAVLLNTDNFYQPAPALALVGELIDGFVGYSYYDVLHIEGGTPPYSNARTIAGAMPAWMSANILDDWLVFTGNPNATGVSTFTPDITDFAGRHADNPQEIEVFGTPPVLTIVGEIPDGYVGQPDWAGVTYTVVGGTAPYTFSSLPGTTFPGILGPMSSAGVVPAEIPDVPGSGLNAIEVLDANGLRGTKADPFIISPPPDVLIADTAANNAFVSYDGRTWTSIAFNMLPGTRSIRGGSGTRMLATAEYSDNYGATAWITYAWSILKNYQVTRRGNNVVWGSNGPFEQPVHSPDNGLTASTSGNVSANGLYAPMYVGSGSLIVGVGDGDFFRTSTDNAATFAPTAQAHGFNQQNISNAVRKYSGGAVFAGGNVTLSALRVVFTAAGGSMSGGDVTSPANNFIHCGKDTSRLCVGYVGGEETVVVLPYITLGNATDQFVWKVIDGGTWAIGTSPLGVGVLLRDIAWNGFVWVLSGSLANVAYLKYSFDLVTWFNCTFPAGAQDFYGISSPT